MKFGRQDYDETIIDVSGRIPEHEPVFLIRGQDRLGGRFVRQWADAAKNLGAEEETVAAARLQASRMDEWRAREGSKVADLGYVIGRGVGPDEKDEPVPVVDPGSSTLAEYSVRDSGPTMTSGHSYVLMVRGPGEVWRDIAAFPLVEDLATLLARLGVPW